MKWIGQHIWSFVTRFRNEVYFDEVPEEDATLTKALVLDGNGLIRVNSSIGGNSSSTTTHIHEEVKNIDGSTLEAGTPVYAVDEVGNSGKVRVGKADASDPNKMPAIGILDQQLTNNSEGVATLVGIFNTNITGFTSLDEGQIMYVAIGGGLTNVKPTGQGNLVQNLGIVLKTNGTTLQGFQVTVVGRSNDIPNLDLGNIFIGDTNNEYEIKSLTDSIEDAGDITVDGQFNVTGRVNLGTSLPTSPSQSDILGVDSTGNIYKQPAPSGGGGSITIVDSDSTGSDVTFNSVDEIKFFGNDVEVYDDGVGKVLVSIPPLAPQVSMSIQDPVSSFSSYRIGNPVNSSGYYFYAGDWGGDNNRKATGDNTLVFNSNTCGNFLIDGSASKIKVSVYGPKDNTTNGNSNLINSHELVVTGNTVSSNSGIQITITNFADDGIPSRKKAKVSVLVTLDNSNLTTVGGNFTGSQKYSSIKIQQLNSAGNSISGVNDFVSQSFFYDNKSLPPTLGSISSYGSGGSSVKQLSNIKYYGSGIFTLSTTNNSNLQRDTGYNSSFHIYSLHYGGLTGSSANDTISGNTYQTNDNTNTSSVSLNVGSSKFVLSGSQYAKYKVRGGLGGDTSYSSNSSSTTSRNYNTHSAGSSKTFESHKDENYRISHHKVGSYKSISSAQTDSEATWKSRCVGANPTSTNNGLPTNHQHLIQGYFGGWRLCHGSFSSIGTIANSPSGGMTNGQKPTSGTFSYIRFFGPFNSSTSSFSIDLGISKSTFNTHAVNSSNLQVYFLVPGNGANQGVWIPLKNTFSSGTPTNGCWANANNQSNGSEQFDIAFGGSAKVVLIKIEMNQNGPDKMGTFLLQSGHVNT